MGLGGVFRRGRVVRVPTGAGSGWSGVRPGRRIGVGARDAEFKTSQGTACNVPGAGRAGGAAWSTCLDHMTGHHRCGRRSGRAPPEGTGVYRGQRPGRGLPLARSPCAGGRSEVWAGPGPRGGAGVDSDGGGDRDSSSDPDARTGTATGSATGTECGPSLPWTRSPAPAGRCGNDEGDPAHVVRGTGSPVVLVGDTGIEPVTSSV